MALPQVNLKVGDQLPVLLAQLVNGDGSLPNLTGATVVFNMWTQDLQTQIVTNAACTVTDFVNDFVTYAWAANDTAKAGNYYGEFKVTFPGGQTSRFPGPDPSGLKPSYITIYIGPALG